MTKHTFAAHKGITSKSHLTTNTIKVFDIISVHSGQHYSRAVCVNKENQEVQWREEKLTCIFGLTWSYMIILSAVVYK